MCTLEIAVSCVARWIMRNGNERPVDIVASRVIARGEHHDYPARVNSMDSDLPLPVKPIPAVVSHSPGFKDYTGATFGRLTVVGLSDTKAKRWVCRCTCGFYSLRTSSAVSGASQDACCDRCAALARAKKRDMFRRCGKHKPLEDFLT